MKKNIYMRMVAKHALPLLALLFLLFAGNAAAQCSAQAVVFMEPVTEDQKVCVSTTYDDCATNTICGADLTNDPNYDVEYFMIRRGAMEDTVWLDPTRNADGMCNGSADDFTCYDGIRIFDGGGSYSCGGYGECRGNEDAAAKVNIAGPYTVYANLLANGVIIINAPINIDGFKGETHGHIVWGKIINVKDTSIKYTLLDSYGKKTTENQSVIAGRRTPIYIVAAGTWQSDGSFYYAVDVVNRSYSLREAGLSDATKNARLKIYESEEAAEQICGGTGYTCSQTFPMSGIDTLWVEGNYEADEFEYNINVQTPDEAAPSLKLRVAPPQLKFMKSDFSTDTSAIGYGGGAIPLVGSLLPIYIQAWDQFADKPCDFCNFNLSIQYSITDDPDKQGMTVVRGSNLTIVYGKTVDATISGQVEVLSPYYADWIVRGPNNAITAIWTELRFKESSVPIISIPSRQIAGGKIQAQTIGNNIVLQNLPSNSKVEVYNLKGNRIYSGNTGNISTLDIGVQAKGMYIVRASFGSGRQVMRITVK